MYIHTHALIYNYHPDGLQNREFEKTPIPIPLLYYTYSSQCIHTYYLYNISYILHIQFLLLFIYVIITIIITIIISGTSELNGIRIRLSFGARQKWF